MVWLLPVAPCGEVVGGMAGEVAQADGYGEAVGAAGEDWVKWGMVGIGGWVYGWVFRLPLNTVWKE